MMTPFSCFVLQACSTFSRLILNKFRSLCSLLRHYWSTTVNAARYYRYWQHSKLRCWIVVNLQWITRDCPRRFTPRLRPPARDRGGSLHLKHWRILASRRVVTSAWPLLIWRGNWEDHPPTGELLCCLLSAYIIDYWSLLHDFILSLCFLFVYLFVV